MRPGNPWLRSRGRSLAQFFTIPTCYSARLFARRIAAIVQNSSAKLPPSDTIQPRRSRSPVLPGGVTRPVSHGCGRFDTLTRLPAAVVFLSASKKAKDCPWVCELDNELWRLDDITVLRHRRLISVEQTLPARAAISGRGMFTGNVRSSCSWRVSMPLFDAMRRRISSEQHDFVLDDVFEVQDEIGRQVVESLRKRFPPALSKSRDRYSSDREAYDEFMVGLGESYSDRPATLESAIDHLSKAIQRDPEFALAHAWLSYVLTNMHFSFDPRPTRLEKAEHHCRLALTLDPALPEGHLARAFILWSPAKNFQHAEALAALDQVLAVRPNFEQAHNRIASICLHIGRLQEARIAHEQAQRSNPKTRSGNLEFFYLYSGDFERAEEAGESWLRERPGATYALFFHPQPPLLGGDLDLAEHRLSMALRQLPNAPLITSLRGILYARRNENDRALECVRRALDLPRSFGHTHHTYYQIACVYAVIGDLDKAMAWLERSVDTGFACWPFSRSTDTSQTCANWGIHTPYRWP